MEGILKFGALTIGLAALALLLIFGFVIWIFLPLLFASIAYVVAYLAKRTVVLNVPRSEAKHAKHAKAA